MSKVLVFCIDALCASDVARMRRMPHFAQLLERGALVEKIEPVLPALTYTCHTSILTGTYAGRHGIVHNEKMTRGGHLDAPWYCMKSDVRGKTLLDIARENGLTTCSLSWPVSARRSRSASACRSSTSTARASCARRCPPCWTASASPTPRA